MEMALEELGVTPPLGFFDPLGLSKFDDPEVFRSLRACGLCLCVCVCV